MRRERKEKGENNMFGGRESKTNGHVAEEMVTKVVRWGE